MASELVNKGVPRLSDSDAHEMLVGRIGNHLAEIQPVVRLARTDIVSKVTA